MILKNLTEIYTGYSFRKRLRDNPSGDTKVIQMGNVDIKSGIRMAELIKINGFNPRNQHYYLKERDIIFVNKGRNLYAYLVPETSGTITAANSFLIIKIKGRRVSSGYLTWYLNSRRLQHHLRTVSAGTTIPNVSISAMESLEVPLPPLERQELISEMNRLKIKETNILEELTSKREEYINLLLQRSVDNL